MAPKRAARAACNENDPFTKQWLPVMEAKWALVEERHDAEQLWGTIGADFVAWQAAMRCHGELVVGSTLLSLAIACSNGSRTSLFGEDASNLWLWPAATQF